MTVGGSRIFYRVVWEQHLALQGWLHPCSQPPPATQVGRSPVGDFFKVPRSSKHLSFPLHPPMCSAAYPLPSLFLPLTCLLLLLSPADSSGGSMATPLCSSQVAHGARDSRGGSGKEQFPFPSACSQDSRQHQRGPDRRRTAPTPPSH